MVFGQHKGAGAGEGFGQGAQVFFLDEVAVDDVRLGQLFAELLQVEGVGQRRERHKGGDQQAEARTALALTPRVRAFGV